MGGLVMIEGSKCRLEHALHSLTEHELVVTPNRTGYLISDGKTTIDASVDADEDSVVFLTFSSQNPFRWLSSSRLIRRVEELIKCRLQQR